MPRWRARTALLSIADQIVQGGDVGADAGTQSRRRAFVRESILRQSPEGYARTCEALASARAADHAQIRCPVLLITGEEDATAPPSVARMLADRIAGARVKILPRCGHWPTRGAPGRGQCGNQGIRLTVRSSTVATNIATSRSSATDRKERPMSDNSTSSPQWNREPIGGEGTTVFTNVRVLTGSGDNPFMGEVAVRGNRIVGIGRGQRVSLTRAAAP